MSNKAINWIITEDARKSDKPAEALRVAAGLSSWGQVSGNLWLCGAAALILDPDHEDVSDPVSVENHLKLLEQSDWQILVKESNPWLNRTQDLPDNLKLIADENWKIHKLQPGDFFQL